jgi:death on curing protein
VTEYLELDDLLAIVDQAVGSGTVIRDAGLLESALARPRATVFGEDAYPDLDTKAAALLASLVSNHALDDGNERLGWVAVRVFYRLNDHDLRAPHDDAFTLVMEVADGSVKDVTQIATRLARWVVRT